MTLMTSMPILELLLQSNLTQNPSFIGRFKIQIRHIYYSVQRLTYFILYTMSGAIENIDVQ